jgi:hypothetical protein
MCRTRLRTCTAQTARYACARRALAPCLAACPQVGGNGGNAAANAIADECEAQGVVCTVVGVPKSIDNDILLIDKCFGFETAVEEAQRALLAAKVGRSGHLRTRPRMYLPPRLPLPLPLPLSGTLNTSDRVWGSLARSVTAARASFEPRPGASLTGFGFGFGAGGGGGEVTSKVRPGVCIRKPGVSCRRPEPPAAAGALAPPALRGAAVPTQL